jgi:tetratricopeptide (TPR) repeat protein
MVEVDPLSIIGRLNYSPVLALKDAVAGREMARGIIGQNAWAGYTALGQIEFQTGKDLSASLGWFMRAYGQDPHDELSNRYLIRILAMVGEYEEARRISDGNLYIADMQENDVESAVHSLRLAHDGDPENYARMEDLADALYFAGQFEESRDLYLQLQKLSPTGVILDSLDASTRPTLRLAFILKKEGDDAGAQKAIALHQGDLDKRSELGLIYSWDYLAVALAHSVEGDVAGTFDSIRKAIDAGFRDDLFFREPALERLAQHPEFLALKAEVDQLLAVEHAQVLQLICHDNPIPDIWQPMSETCSGITPGA